MNRKRIVLAIMLLMIGCIRFEVDAAYMGYTGVVKNEIGLKAVKSEIVLLSSSGSNAERTASYSNANVVSSASNAERKKQFKKIQNGSIRP